MITRILLSALLCFGLLNPAQADSLSLLGVGNGGGVTYVGPCDVTLTAPCAVEYSVSHSPTKNYSGPLFQVYNGTSTTDIPQLSNHIVDKSALLAACAGKPVCLFSGVYDAKNGNTIVPTVTTNANAPAACNSGTFSCAPPVIIDPTNGLPVLATPYPTEMYDGGTVTGINGGTGPLSAFAYLPTNAGYSQCCGFFGIAHLMSAADTAGTDFLIGLGYSNGRTFQNCSTSTTLCGNVDIETFMNNGADYSPTALQTVAYMAATDGSAATDNIKVYVNNSAPIYSGTASATLNVGTAPRVGAGGDGSHVNTMLQDGLIANAQWGGTDYTNIKNNLAAFYSAQSKDACSGTGDIGYYWTNSGGAQTLDVSPLSTLLDYALYRVRASYFGPIADLRNSLGTVQTFGPALTGCDIDPAARTFCTANPPCTVQKIYLEGTYSSVNVGNAHDSLLDLSQATVASQPQVNLTGLNGHMTMVFSGAQSLCSGTPGSNQTYFTAVAVVAKRTGSTTGFNAVLNVGGDNSSIGFDSSSGSLYAFIVAGASAQFIHGGTYAEGHFHSIIAEVLNTTANQDFLYGDNSSIGTATAAGFPNIGGGVNNKVCLGVNQGGSTPNDFLTGEIAHAAIIASGVPGGVGVASHTQAFTAEEGTWGTLPN